MFRQRPAELFFEQAKKKNVGIIVRVPLVSGLLTGTLNKDTIFTSGDHRNFNRERASFDKGETFSGIDYKTGLVSVEALKSIFPNQVNLAPVALKWILMNDAVSCIIPGASKVEQVKSNLDALIVPDITPIRLTAVLKVYNEYIRNQVHQF